MATTERDVAEKLREALGVSTLTEAVLLLASQKEETERRVGELEADLAHAEGERDGLGEECRRLRAELGSAEGERDRLLAERGKVTCAYCWTRLEPGATLSAMREHAASCAGHPAHRLDRHARVREFCVAFGHPVPPSFSPLDGDTLRLRARLTLEEAIEYVQASGFGVHWDEKAGAWDVHLTSAYPDYEAMVDASVDVGYVAEGNMVVMGLPSDLFFDEVHRSNMAKLWPDGKPRRRPDGKILKPPGWVPPDVAGVLARYRAVGGRLA